MSQSLQVVVQYVTVSTGGGAVCHGIYRWWCSMSRFLQLKVQYVMFSTDSGVVCHGLNR